MDPQLMPLESDIEESIRLNAQAVIDIICQQEGVTLAFNAPSIEWIDGYIERCRGSVPEETIEGLISVLGSFVGECIRAQFGGYWARNQYGLSIAFNEKNSVYPFSKVRKQFDRGREAGDSVFSFFTTIPIVFELTPKNPDELR
jgi:hypothetical protein